MKCTGGTPCHRHDWRGQNSLCLQACHRDVKLTSSKKERPLTRFRPNFKLSNDFRTGVNSTRAVVRRGQPLHSRCAFLSVIQVALEQNGAKLTTHLVTCMGRHSAGRPGIAAGASGVLGLVQCLRIPNRARLPARLLAERCLQVSKHSPSP